MRKRFKTILVSIMIACAPSAATDNNAPPDWVADARASAGRLGGDLRQALMQALGESGPVGALEVCRIRAPEIAASVDVTGRLEVGRTALRVRNPDNAPDAWERRMLEDFAARMDAGVPAAELEVFAVTVRDGQRRGRWMRAIPMQPPCTVCHGSNLAPAVAEGIERYYPDDEATGFTPGELRGAFSMSVTLHPGPPAAGTAGCPDPPGQIG